MKRLTNLLTSGCLRNVYNSARALAIATLIGCVAVLMTSCKWNSTHNGEKLETPIFVKLEIPFHNGWESYLSLSPIPEVLPVKGRGVKVSFSAPLGAFVASLRALDGTTVALNDSHGNPQSDEVGYFQTVSVDPNSNPPIHVIYVRAPLSLSDQANYDVLIVNKSLRTDTSDSDPLIVPLRHRKDFTVNVTVVGDGHVTSNPPGIECGKSFSGRPLTACSFDFGPGTVTLLPGANNLNNTKFVKWAGNCDPNVQICSLNLDGNASVSASAIFDARNTPPPDNCPAAPIISGLRWIAIPACATEHPADHPGITNPAVCDESGYYCCEPGPSNANSPRCGGFGKIESLPDCRHHAPNGMLIQPGGCYEINPGP